MQKSDIGILKDTAIMSLNIPEKILNKCTIIGLFLKTMINDLAKKIFLKNPLPKNTNIKTMVKKFADSNKYFLISPQLLFKKNTILIYIHIHTKQTP